MIGLGFFPPSHSHSAAIKHIACNTIIPTFKRQNNNKQTNKNSSYYQVQCNHRDTIINFHSILAPLSFSIGIFPQQKYLKMSVI